jgi:hypothetical protein
MDAGTSEATELAAAIKRPVLVMKELRQTEQVLCLDAAPPPSTHSFPSSPHSRAQSYLDSLHFLQEHYIPQIRRCDLNF